MSFKFQTSGSYLFQKRAKRKKIQSMPSKQMHAQHSRQYNTFLLLGLPEDSSALLFFGVCLKGKSCKILRTLNLLNLEASLKVILE